MLCVYDVFMKVNLSKRLESMVSRLLADAVHLRGILPTILSFPPPLKNVPPTSTMLLWLHAVKERVTLPMERVREAAPYLLTGNTGFSLRHAHGDLIKEINRQGSS